jgi:hypothetical protein
MFPVRGQRIWMRRWRRAGDKRRPLPRTAGGSLAPGGFFAGRAFSARNEKPLSEMGHHRSDDRMEPLGQGR